MSFQHNDLVSPPHWVGVANYQALRHDPVFRDSINHTIVYTVLFVPISIAAALAVAVALNARIRGIAFYRTAVFIPVAVSTVATAIIFNWVLDPTYGIANWLLNEVGHPLAGLLPGSQPGHVLHGGDDGLGLGRVRRDHLPRRAPGHPPGAARGGRHRRRQPVFDLPLGELPLLGPATLFLVVWSTINALQLFDEIYNTTRGGPLMSTTVVVYYLWQQAFQFFNGGYAAAIAYVLFLAILVITLIQFLISRKTVYYSS